MVLDGASARGGALHAEAKPIAAITQLSCQRTLRIILEEDRSVSDVPELY
jgi:hypothetical protein